MRCQSCNQEYEQQSKFCPNCGAPQPSGESSATDAFGQQQQQQPAYVRPDYDPARDGRYNVPQTAVPVTGNYGQAIPSATGQIVFSIVNIVCCGGFVGTVLGVIALIFAIMAGSDTNYDEAERKLKTAKTLNIIGICIAALFLIIGIVIFVGSLAAGSFQYFDYYG